MFDIREGILYRYQGQEAEITIPASVYAIGEKAFQLCETLKKVVISEGVRRIDWAAFRFCSNLTEVQIPASVEFIAVTAFEQCSNLKTIVIAPQNPRYFAAEDGIHSRRDDDVIGTGIRH